MKAVIKHVFVNASNTPDTVAAKYFYVLEIKYFTAKVSASVLISELWKQIYLTRGLVTGSKNLSNWVWHFLNYFSLNTLTYLDFYTYGRGKLGPNLHNYKDIIES